MRNEIKPIKIFLSLQFALTLLLLVFFLSGTSFAEKALIIAGEVGNKATVRSAPKRRARIIGRVKKGKSYKILNKSRSWYKIKFGKKQGWIHKSLLKIIQEGARPQRPRLPSGVKKNKKILPPPPRKIKKRKTRRRIEKVVSPPKKIRKRQRVAAQSELTKNTIYIPAGEFSMGNSGDRGESDEYPAHKVYLDTFYLDKYEITNREFRRFISLSNYKTDAEKIGNSWVWKGEWEQIRGANWSRPQGSRSSISQILDHPVVQVSWNDAHEYCDFFKKRLPTEAEWEKAARGKKNSLYPWGNKWDPLRSNYSWEKGPHSSSPIGRYPRGASSFGVMDLAGNVAEWVSDWYGENYYRNSPQKNPSGPSSGRLKVIRGGSWVNTDPFYLRSVDRTGALPESSWIYLGFRCARSG